MGGGAFLCEVRRGRGGISGHEAGGHGLSCQETRRFHSLEKRDRRTDREEECTDRGCDSESTGAVADGQSVEMIELGGGLSDDAGKGVQGYEPMRERRYAPRCAQYGCSYRRRSGGEATPACFRSDSGGGPGNGFRKSASMGPIKTTHRLRTEDDLPRLHTKHDKITQVVCYIRIPLTTPIMESELPFLAVQAETGNKNALTPPLISVGHNLGKIDDCQIAS